MRTVDYITVQKGAADLCGLDRTNLSVLEQARLQQWLSKRLAAAWEYHFWPELVRVEERFFRQDYSAATTYQVSQEVYYPPTSTYYQALKTGGFSGQAPADSSDVLNSSYWAVCAASYSGADWDATVTYSAGTIVYYDVTNRFYQYHGTTGFGHLPTVAAYWGVLTPFDRYVAYDQSWATTVSLGHPLNTYTRNPRVFSNPQEVDFTLSENGVQVLAPLTSVWIRFRLKTPVFSGSVYSASATYAVDQQIYYSSATLPGNFYDCITATSAGQSPDSSAAKWRIVDIPRLFQRYLEHGAYADYLTAEGNENAPREHGRAETFLARQSFVLANQQQQRERTVVLTR